MNSRIGFSRKARGLVVAFAIAALGGGFVTSLPTALAGTGGEMVLPQLPKKPKNGLQVVVDTRWVNANGYRPVRIKLQNWPAGPTTADRSFRIELQPFKWQNGWGPNRVTGFVDMPQGTATAEAVISVPQFLGMNSLGVKVFEDGYELTDVSGQVNIPVRVSYEWSEVSPAILFIDRDAPPPEVRLGIVNRSNFPGVAVQQDTHLLPDLRPITFFHPDASQYGVAYNWQAEGNNTDDATQLRIVEDLSRVELLPPQWLPTKWRDLTCFDVIFISFADLRQMAVDQPEQRLQALLEWAMTGPTLCVYGVKQNEAELKALAKLLGMPEADSQPTGDGEDDPATAAAKANTIAGWTTATGLQNAVEARGMREVWQARGMSPQTLTDTSNDKSPQPISRRKFGLGRVIAIASDEPWGQSVRQFNGLFNEIDRINWAWYQRHGVSFHRENTDFWDWLIPGIGQAPVNSYLVLISLFVIGIGPVNYFMLKRKKRLYLLLVTVPLGAGLVTTALMNYALISDGLGTRVRVRSFTELDQRIGQAVAWSRQTYYAGLAPSGGLSFPEDAAVYPIDHHPQDYREQNRYNRRLVWDGEQKLASGYLNSRSTSQYLVVQTQPSVRNLKIEAIPGSSPSLRVTNNLDVKILQLAICNGLDQHFLATGVAASETVTARAISAADCMTALRTTMGANRPAAPQGYDPNYYQRSYGYNAVYSSNWNRNDSGMPVAKFATGILERSLNESLYSRSGRLESRTYVAIVERSPEVATGYERAREEASFHVILGRW